MIWMSHANTTKCNMTLIQPTCKKKLILKQKSNRFYTINTSYMKTLEAAQIFGS